LLRETEMSIKRRGQVVDQMAAVLILQSWMEYRAQAGRNHGVAPGRDESGV
jgi:RNase H-fold protein (predicted Holliday junction resolvase)